MGTGSTSDLKRATMSLGPLRRARRSCGTAGRDGRAPLQGGVLEVSSEALAHRSFDGIAFHAAVVTDVAAPVGFPPEVLLQKRRAKAKLFRQIVPGGVAVVNADDPHAEVLGGINLDARRVAFALEPAAAARDVIDVSARLERIDGSGTRMLLHGFDREAAVHLPLIGPRVADLRTRCGRVGVGRRDRSGRRRRRT